MYLRTTKRRNQDGSVVRYLQLAHNYRDPVSGTSRADIIHNFGRLDQVDQVELAQLSSSIDRYIKSVRSTNASPDRELQVLSYSLDLGTWVLDSLWQQLGIGRAIAEVATDQGVDSSLIERVVFSLTAFSALSELECVTNEDWTEGQFVPDALMMREQVDRHRAVGFLASAQDDLYSRIQRELVKEIGPGPDVFVISMLDADSVCGASAHCAKTRDDVWEAGEGSPHGFDELVAIAITRHGIPVKMWRWDSDVPPERNVAQIAEEIDTFGYGQTTWILSQRDGYSEIREALTAGGHGFVVAERLRGHEHDVAAARARQGRYHRINDSLTIKQARVGDGPLAEHFIVCRSTDRAQLDETLRHRLISLIESEIDGSDTESAIVRSELYERLTANAVMARYLRKTSGGLLRIDRSKLREDERLDGKFLLRASGAAVSATDFARGHMSMLEFERAWHEIGRSGPPDVQHSLEYFRAADLMIRWLALITVRVAEIRTGHSWNSIRGELGRLGAVCVSTGDGQVAHRNILSAKQRTILQALGVPEPEESLEP